MRIDLLVHIKSQMLQGSVQLALKLWFNVTVILHRCLENCNMFSL